MGECSEGRFRGYDRELLCVAFTDQNKICTSDDTRGTGWTPVLAELDSAGTTSEFIDRDGAAYWFSQIDYIENNKIHANRVIARIPPSSRTELLYLSELAPHTALSVHKGQGTLVLAKPGNESLSSFTLNADTNITVPSGVFYTVHSASNSLEELVVSCFYDHPKHDWKKLVKEVKPSDMSIKAPEGYVWMSETFRSLYYEENASLLIPKISPHSPYSLYTGVNSEGIDSRYRIFVLRLPEDMLALNATVNTLGQIRDIRKIQFMPQINVKEIEIVFSTADSQDWNNSYEDSENPGKQLFLIDLVVKSIMRAVRNKSKEL